MSPEFSVFRKIYLIPLILSGNKIDNKIDHRLKYDIIVNTVDCINTTHIASILEQSY